MALTPAIPSSSPAASGSVALLVTTPAGVIGLADVAARRWLKRYFSRPVKSNRLPRLLHRWMRENPHRRGHKSLQVRRGTHRLSVRRGSCSAESIVLQMELHPERGWRAGRTFGDLTSRETEVLHWIAANKSNKEIGEILHTAEATVARHVHHLLAKLGVDSRMVAAKLYRRGNR